MHLLHHLLERSAGSHSDKEAVVDKDRRFTYASLHRTARACAARLQKERIEDGDRVGIYLPKSFEECACIFGISLAGGVVVPINPLLRPKQVAHILRDGGVRFLVTQEARWNGLQEALERVGALEVALLLDGDGGDGRVRTRVLEGAGEPGRASGAAGTDLAAILYTSGSTGSPKGVMITHDNLLAGSRIVCGYLDITRQERILSILPFSFDYGLNQLITAVEKAATTVLLTFRFGNEIVRALTAERITGLAGVPTIWAVLMGTPSFKKTSLPELRYLTNSGGAVPAETVRGLRELLKHTDLILMYGLTEAFRSTYLPASEVDARPTSMGKAIPETKIFLVNDAGELCAPDEEGILFHSGPTVSLGYWQRPADTAKVIRPHPFEPDGPLVCYSGDRVRMDADGYFYFVGRDDAMIKCQGYRVSSTEVEEVLMSAGLLAQAAVIGLPDPNSGQRVHAVVRLLDGEAPDRDRLLAHCGKELPPHMVPREVEFVDELPRSPNGKVDYKVLKAERMGEATK